MENKIQKIVQIGVPVKDVERAASFYSEKLGLNLLFKTDTMAFLETDGIRILLTLPENDSFTHPSSVLYFQVEDIEAAFEANKKQGITFIDEPHIIARMGDTETWMAFFYDSEENTHALMCEKTAE
ncbi:VOC family protein [Peribacillus kribbensis]|uniref:VOC family protein n=1 Tax=Peribacillus kribbensis TaxID=356658 RepID=UPI0004009D8A|nr:VOC family protein [Peribacillus kribbensis]